MKLTVNGQPLEAAAVTLAALLDELGYEDALVATALNSAFVPAHERDTTPLKDQDRIEILAPMKGG